MSNVSNDIAVLRDNETIYRATSVRDCAPLHSAPVALIQAIYDLKPEQARRITRQRIFTTLPSTESISGIVKVAAKRITTSLQLHSTDLTINDDANVVDVNAQKIWRPEQPSLPDLAKTAQSDAEWMQVARSLANKVDRRGPRYAADRPIGAILISDQNQVLAAAINTNAKNRTLHAEMNLVAALSECVIPPHSKLFTTLKPCKMCAGMIVDSAQDIQSLNIIFAENDPGPRAQNTALDRHNARCAHPIQSQLET